MADKTVYPFGTEGHLPGSIGIVNDLTTGGANNALSAQQGVVLKGLIDDLDGRGGLSMDAKNLLLNILKQAVFATDDVKADIDALEDMICAELVSISAVFTPGTAKFYPGESLDVLKPYLVVSTLYDDGTSENVSTYTLSGELTAGTSTITVTFSDKTTTFTVTVEAVSGIVRGPSYFAYGIGLQSSSTSDPGTINGETYYFTKPNSKRASYYLFDIELEAGVTYEYRVKLSGFGETDLLSIGLPFFSESFQEDGLANASGKNHGSDVTDNGWISTTRDGDEFVITAETPANRVGTRLTFKTRNYRGTEIDWPAEAIIERLIIQEITE